MGQGYNKLIQGECLNVLPNNNIKLFKNLTVHTIAFSPQGNNYQSGIFGCGRNAPYTPESGTQIIPPQLIYPSGSLFRASYQYSQTTNSVSPIAYNGKTIYVKQTDLNPWKQRNVYFPAIYRTFAQGPALKQAHCWSQLYRKPADSNTYVGRQEYNFLDYSSPLIGTNCKLNDFLIFAHSNVDAADYLYTNVTEPFQDDTYYEGSGTNPPTSTTLGGNNFLEFCNPLNCYDSDGQLIGTYVGYSSQYIFGRCTLVTPMTILLPPNPNSPLPTPPKVVPTYAYYSLEQHVYLVGNTPELGSPLLQKRRWWVYVEDGTGSTISIWEPYFTMYLGSFTTNWQFDVNFNIEGGSSETILFNLSNWTNYVGAS